MTTDAVYNEERILAKLKLLYDEELLKDLNDRKNTRKHNIQKQYTEARELLHKVIVDELSTEWLKLVETGTSQQHKARYLLADQVLPPVIIGLTKLLTEVDRRGLAADSEEPNFNPINYLAQFLMRNNPKQEVFPEQNPYICGMRKVAAQLSAKFASAEQVQLADLRTAIDRRKMEISMAKLQRASEYDQRISVFSSQFPEWGIASTDGVVEGVLVEGALRAFIERYEESLVDLYQARAMSFFTALSEKIKSPGLNSSEYSSILAKRSTYMTVEVFTLFVSHLSSCAEMYRKTFEISRNFEPIANLYTNLDAHKEGRINRDIVVQSLQKIYSSIPPEKQDNFIAPTKWPVVPPEEDNSAEDILPLEVEPPVSDIFELPPEPKEEGEGEEGEGEPPAEDAPRLEPEKTEIHDEPTTETVNESDMPGDELRDAEAAVTEPPVASEPVVSFAEAELVASAITIEPVSGEVAVSDANMATSAPPQRPGTLQITETTQPVSSAPVTRPPAQIGTVIENDQDAEELEPLADKPEYATVSRLLRTSSMQMEAFDSKTLTHKQFLQTVQNFVLPAAIGAEETDAKQLLEDHLPREVESAIRTLSKNLTAGYIETETDVAQRLRATKLAAAFKMKHDRLDKLFDRWDNEGQGVVDLDEVENLLSRYKHGQENAIIKTVVNNFMASDPIHTDRRLSRNDFRTLIVDITNNLPGPDESFEYLLSFMSNAIKLSLVEQLRGSCRRRWLAEIQTAITTAGLSLENVFRAAFQAIYKDAELHGDRKQINVYVSLAERVPEAERAVHGDGLCLRYVAATPKDAPHVLNKRLYRDMPGVSLSVLDTGRPIHVPRISVHGNVYFWNPNRPKSDRDGSFLVLPLKETSRKQCFGVLGVDTIGDPQNLAGVAGGSFVNHEIKFYQGVAAALADAFRVVQHAVDLTEQLNRAVPLIFGSSTSVLSAAVYLTEIDPRTSWTAKKKRHDGVEGEGDEESDESSSLSPGTEDEVVLRKVLEADRMRQKIEQIGNQPARLLREQNLFREYVFTAASTGTTVVKKSYGERRIAIPLRRPSDGRTVAVFDLGVKDPGKDRTVVRSDGTMEKKPLPLLPSDDRVKIVRIMRAAQAAVGELSMDFMTTSDGGTIVNPKILYPPGGERITLIAETQSAGSSNSSKIKKALMLDRLILASHRAQIRKYPDTDVFADLRQIGRPNNYNIHQFTTQLVCLAYPKYQAQADPSSDWLHCKVYLTGEMRDRLLAIDPSHPKIANFIMKKITLNAPMQDELMPLLVTTRLKLLHDFLITCQRIALTTLSIAPGGNFGSPPVSLDTPFQDSIIDSRADNYSH